MFNVIPKTFVKAWIIQMSALISALFAETAEAGVGGLQPSSVSSHGEVLEAGIPQEPSKPLPIAALACPVLSTSCCFHTP